MRFPLVLLIAVTSLICSSAAHAQNATRPKNPVRIYGGILVGPKLGYTDSNTFESARADDLSGGFGGYRYGVSYDFYRTRSRTYSVFFAYYDYMNQNYSKSDITFGSYDTFGLFPSDGKIPDAKVSYSAVGLGIRSYPFGVKRSKFNLFVGFGAGFYRADSESYGLVGDDIVQYGKITDTTTRLGGKIFFGGENSHFFWEASGIYAGSIDDGLPGALNHGAVSLGLRF